MSGATAEIERLQQSVSQVQQLRSSAAVSIGMMALGVAILVGGIAYTAAKVAPLERRAAALRADTVVLRASIAQMESDALARRTELARSADALALVQRQVDSINTALRRLVSTGTLAPAAQSQVASALESGRRAEVTVATAEQNISPSASTARPRESVDTLLERLFDQSPVVRLRAYDDLMAQHGASPDLIPALVRYADAHPDNLNGIYNALVVLNTVPRRQLGPHQAQVRAFLDRVEGLGPRIKARTDDVRGRLRTDVTGRPRGGGASAQNR